jgi:HAMP domain-containing protein
MNKEQLIEEIREIERKVEEFQKSVPIHSPKVPMMQELEDLEEKIIAKKKMLNKV